MNYEGKLYGKVGRRLIPLTMTSQDVDRMEHEVRELREALEKERKAVAEFLIPWRRHLDKSWLDHFVNSGIVFFDECGFVFPKELTTTAKEGHETA